MGFRGSSGGHSSCPPVCKSQSNCVRTLFSSVQLLLRTQGTDPSQGRAVRGTGWFPKYLRDRGWVPRTKERPPLGFVVLLGSPSPCQSVRKSSYISVRTFLSPFRLLLRSQGTVPSHVSRGVPLGFRRSSGGPVTLSTGPEAPSNSVWTLLSSLRFFLQHQRVTSSNGRAVGGAGCTPSKHFGVRWWVPRSEGRTPWGFTVLHGAPYPCPQVRKSPSNSVWALLL